MFAAARRACSRAAISRASGRVRGMSAYEGEGKTTVTILNKDLSLAIMINSFSTIGFKLNNGVTVLGPMALFPRAVLSWQVQKGLDVTEDSLRLFTVLEPRVDVLIVGLESRDERLAQPVRRLAHRLRLNVEVLETEHACATYNFLAAEGRSVAAAMIPPLRLTMTDNDVLDDDNLRQKVFVKEDW